MSDAIKVFNASVEMIGVITDYENFVFVRGWNDPGEFSFEVNANSEFASIIAEDTIILVDQDRIGWVDTVVTTRANEQEYIYVSGVELKDILAWRETKFNNATINYATQKVETIVKDLISKNIGATAEGNRKVNEVRTIPILSGEDKGSNVKFSTYHKRLSEEVYSLLKIDRLGLKTTLAPSAKKIDFDVLAGTDRTKSQYVNDPVMFSVDFKTLDSIDYKKSKAALRNVIFVGGQGEGNNRTIVTVGSGAGVNRRELFVDARDTNDADILASRGAQALSEYSSESAINCDVRETGTYIYQTDYDLGDLVTIIDKKIGITSDAQITAVTETRSQQNPLDVKIHLGYDSTSLKNSFARVVNSTKAATTYGSPELSNYAETETGTWTPTIYGATTAGGASYTAQAGNYVVVGNMVLCQFRVQLSSKGTMAGAVRIGGLPFAANPSSVVIHSHMAANNLTRTNAVGVLVRYVADNYLRAYVELSSSGAISFSEVQPADCAANVEFSGTVMYQR